MKKYIIIITLLYSCSSVKKTTDIKKEATDSTSTSQVQSQVEKHSDNTVENYIAKDTSTGSEETLHIEFSDSSKEVQPVIIKKDNGSTSIDAGNRKIKSITQKNKSLNTSKIETKETTKVIDNSIVTNQKKDSTTLKKNTISTTTTKKSFRFNWLWLLIVIPVSIFVYIKYKK